MPEGIRKHLSRMALGMRSSYIPDHPNNRPIHSSEYIFTINNQRLKRKKIILNAPGCRSATCTMCPIPNESQINQQKNFTADHFVEQFEHAVAGDSLDDFDLISIYNSGNWFTDLEIPAKSRQYIYDRVRKSRCRGIMVEALPHFITQSAIDEVKQHMGGKDLVVGIGLQSANDYVRSHCINTPVTKSEFERATSLLRVSGYTPRVYLMLKPPFLSDSEALYDSLESLFYVQGVGYRDASVNATRISYNTVAHNLYSQGLYLPPSLWLIVRMLMLAQNGIFVRIPYLDFDGRSDHTLYPSSCNKCRRSLLNELVKFNENHDVSSVLSISCDCASFVEAQKLTPEKPDERKIEERIVQFLQGNGSLT